MTESSSPNRFVAPEPADLAPLFPAYEIHNLIATGGMGAVYRAVQKSLDRTVALKILPMEFSEDAEFCAGFEAEAKAMARLNHPNLIGVYDFGEVNGMLFIVMEFVPGQSIYHAANGVAIDQGEVIRLITGVCNGLAHAHENGILHRDIKPSNILLTASAEPKIGDFGLARPIDQKAQTDEVIFGTPGYTAPEVIKTPNSVDHRTDLFSVGVLLHELLTGKLPGDDARPASVISGCDLRFDAIIRRATNPVPATRYSSAAEIAADLQKISAAPVTGPMTKSLGVSKSGVRRPPGPVRARSAGVKRKSSSLTWVGPLVAIAIIAYAWHTFMNVKPKTVVIENPVARPAPVISPDKDMEEVKIPDEPQIAPAQPFPAQAQPEPAAFNQVEPERIEIDRQSASPEPDAMFQKSSKQPLFIGDWESPNSRISIREDGTAVSDFFKDREKEVFSHTAESTWKENGTANQIIIYRAKDPNNFSTFTMDGSGNSFDSINSKGVKNHYSRSAKAIK
jgi:serine/threonine protein kinase